MAAGVHAASHRFPSSRKKETCISANRESNPARHRPHDGPGSIMQPKRELMNISFEIIEGQRFASRGREPDNIGILDSDGRTFILQRGRDGIWSIPFSNVAAWNSDADQDYAAENYDADEIAEIVGADADLFGIAASFIDKRLSIAEQSADFQIPERPSGIVLIFHPALATMKARRLETHGLS